MAGNFQDGVTPGKIQWGSAWWFLDQKDGMLQQLNALSNMGLLSRFVGMLTDSRSFMSFPRHEYFRRTLCNLLGTDIIEVRYGDFAARLEGEYRVPLYTGQRSVYAIDVFAAAGIYAGEGITSGQYNTALGYNALPSTTTVVTSRTRVS